jgi:hypothetical protein
MTRTDRRGVLALGIGAILATAGRVRAQAPALVPDTATLLLPGPEGGAASQWAGRVAAGLTRGLPHAVALRLSPIGGPDGVTAANRFATMETGDGRTLLVLPGLAAQARLIGESRAQFQIDGWLPLCVSWQGALLAGRGPRPAPGQPLRLALPGPDAPETAVLLALELQGRRPVPVFGLAGPAAEAALARGEADAMVLASPSPLRRADRLGLTAWAELDTPGRRDLPQLPLLADAPSGARPSQVAAVQAGFAALRLRAALLLPALTSADVVAVWRRAALRWQEEELKDSPETATPALIGTEARAAVSALCPSADAVLVYREWLLRRLNWQAA